MSFFGPSAAAAAAAARFSILFFCRPLPLANIFFISRCSAQRTPQQQQRADRQKIDRRFAIVGRTKTEQKKKVQDKSTLEEIFATAIFEEVEEEV